MNTARIAELLRELADALEAEDEKPAEKRQKPKSLTDIDKARARRALRKLGVDV